MSTKSKDSGKLTLVSLVLMIFTSVFGFANMPRSFYLMGVWCHTWYIFIRYHILCAICIYDGRIRCSV